MVCFIHNKKKTGCMLRCSQYTAGLLLLCPCFFDKFTRRIRISLLLRILLFPYHRSGRASRPAGLQKLFRERYLRPDLHFPDHKHSRKVNIHIFPSFLLRQKPFVSLSGIFSQTSSYSYSIHHIGQKCYISLDQRPDAPQGRTRPVLLTGRPISWDSTCPCHGASSVAII